MFNLVEKAYAQIRPVAPTVTQLGADITAQQIFERIIDWALYFGGAIAVIYLIYGGFMYITSAGDNEKAEQGKRTLTFAIIGIILIALSFIIVGWVMSALGGTFS